MDATSSSGASSGGPARKTLFRKSGGDDSGNEGTINEEQMHQSDKQEVQEILSQLREEVNEMERTDWMFDDINEQVIKV